jgi:hypothetical protein
MYANFGLSASASAKLAALAAAKPSSTILTSSSVNSARQCMKGLVPYGGAKERCLSADRIPCSYEFGHKT